MDFAQASSCIRHIYSCTSGTKLSAIAIGLMTLLWAPVYYILDVQLLYYVCIIFGTVILTAGTLCSESVAGNVISGCLIAGFTAVAWSYGGQCVVRTFMGITPLVHFFLCGNVEESCLWGVVCAVIMVSLILMCDTVSWEAGTELPVLQHIAWDLSFSVCCFFLVLLYESKETEAARARSKFVASVSHELRTPLNGIVCAAELLLEREISNESDVQDVGTIFGCGQLMSSLINNVLDAEMFNSPSKVRYAGFDKAMMFNMEEVSKGLFESAARKAI